MSKVALVIIYNHQYNKNIDIIERIYKGRFNNIYHLVPFYNGDKANVIPVYDNSQYFQGYVAQGLKSFYQESYTHYFFVADDMVINPIINEDNYTTHFNLDEDSCFLPGFIPLHEVDGVWQNKKAHQWRINQAGIEVANQLPDYKIALQKFAHFGLSIKPLRFTQLWDYRKLKDYMYVGRPLLSDSLLMIKELLRGRHLDSRYQLSYPMVGSYADIFIVNAKTIKEFCHYSGVFAATRLFVELAVPTSLVLSAKKIVTEKDLNLQGKSLWSDREKTEELDTYGNSLKQLLKGFPKNYIYLHPIKLSKWNIDL